MSNEIIVIGGGASGMMAAISAARQGARVTILEQKESPGKKLLATGNGHCNFTNEVMQVSCFHGNTWAMEQISLFDEKAVMAFFLELGIYPISKNGYIYPASEQASSMLMVLETELHRLGVHIICNAQVKRILPEKKGRYAVDVILQHKREAELISKQGNVDKKSYADKKGKKPVKNGKARIETERKSFLADKVILATGGKAAPKLGSDGSGYYLSGLLGHGLVETLPALTGIRCQEAWFEDLAGVRIQGKVSVWNEEQKLLAEDQGEIQLTNYGISGIPVFQISRTVAKELAAGRSCKVSMHFHPAIPEDAYQSYLAEHDERVYGGMFPDKLLQVLRRETGALAGRSLWCTPVEMNEWDKAQVTTGGIPLDEIAGGSMESKCCPGIYIVGELADVDGICGGYNLQWAWTSGYLAGKHAAEN